MFTENKTEVSELYTDCLVISTAASLSWQKAKKKKKKTKGERGE